MYHQDYEKEEVERKLFHSTGLHILCVQYKHSLCLYIKNYFMTMPGGRNLDPKADDRDVAQVNYHTPCGRKIKNK